MARFSGSPNAQVLDAYTMWTQGGERRASQSGHTKYYTLCKGEKKRGGERKNVDLRKCNFRSVRAFREGLQTPHACRGRGEGEWGPSKGPMGPSRAWRALPPAGSNKSSYPSPPLTHPCPPLARSANTPALKDTATPSPSCTDAASTVVGRAPPP